MTAVERVPQQATAGIWSDNLMLVRYRFRFTTPSECFGIPSPEGQASDNLKRLAAFFLSASLVTH